MRVPKLLYELLPELRNAAGLTQEALAYKTGDPSREGISVGSVRQYEKPARAGVVPEVEILDVLGLALGVDPKTTFYEYPLAAARRSARPGVSSRRSSVAADEMVEEIEEAGRQRDRRPRPSDEDDQRTLRSRPGA